MVVVLENKTYRSLQLNSIPDHFWQGFPQVKGASVFLKPNLVTPKSLWDSDSTTDVRVTELVIQKLIAEEAKEIIVGECGFKNQWEATMKTTGYDALEEKYSGKVRLIPLQDGPNFHKFTLQRLEKYLSLYGVKFSDYMLACDVVINLPKMKVHTMAGVTGAIKNMMGTMAQKGSMHPRANANILHKRLADLYQLTKSFVRFTVMDGIVGAEYSEQCGLPIYSKVLISGIDQWEVDVAATKLMGIDPNQIQYLKNIRRDFQSIEVPSSSIQHYEMPLSKKR